jgi:1-phosphofructokinase
MQIFTVGWNPAVDRILSCPEFSAGTHQKVHLIARLAAGKAANVSRALALLGCNSIALGLMGRDESAFFSSQLESLRPGKIQCHWVLTDQLTRENVTILTDRPGLETHLREDGFQITEDGISAVENQLEIQARSGDITVIAGALPTGLSAGRHTSIVNRLHQSGIRVAVDTSGIALRDALSLPLWLVKPNLEELSEALGHTIPNDPAAIVSAVESQNIHPENILISRGAAGAVLISRFGRWSGTLKPPGPVLSTVGCGDHLLAGFVWQAAGGGSGAQSLRAALAVATLRAVSTDPASFDRTQVAQISQMAEVFSL